MQQWRKEIFLEGGIILKEKKNSEQDTVKLHKIFQPHIHETMLQRLLFSLVPRTKKSSV